MDTNALSAAADGEPEAARLVGQGPLIGIPVIVIGEYRSGIELSRRKREYERWLGDLIPTCRVLDVTEETASCYAEIRIQLRRAGTPIPTNDIWIAALCLQHALPLLSRDRHFDRVKGLSRLDW